MKKKKPTPQEALDRIRKLAPRMYMGDVVLIHKEFCRRKDCNTCLKGEYGQEIKYSDGGWDF